MMAIDIIACIINQSSLIDVFQRIQAIDEQLAKENIFVSFKLIRKFSIFLIVIAFLSEIGLTFMNLVIFLDDLMIWKSILWLMTGFPLFINFIGNCQCKNLQKIFKIYFIKIFLAKIWFLCLILLIRQRLMTINKHLSDLAESFGDKKSKLGKNEFFVQTVEFLRNEIGGQRVIKSKNFGWEAKNIQFVAPYKEPEKGKIFYMNLRFKF